MTELLSGILEGDHRALARAITRIENREPGYRELVSALHAHTGSAEIVGITGSPGAGKSTLVDKLARAYREQDLTVGIIAVDPASPFTGGAILGDRIRMAGNAGDMDVFVRSMSARGRLGGLSTATADAITAFDAFGKDVIIVETVGAGQNEIDIVRTADTVCVLVPPDSGDAVQMLKAGILEIADIFVVNKADKAGADRTVHELRELVNESEDRLGSARIANPHRAGSTPDNQEWDWEPPIVETVATAGEGMDELRSALSAHREFLVNSGLLESKAHTRYAEEIRTLLRADTATLVESALEDQGGVHRLAEAIRDRETDPYTVAEEVLAPIEACFEEARLPAATDHESGEG